MGALHYASGLDAGCNRVFMGFNRFHDTIRITRSSSDEAIKDAGILKRELDRRKRSLIEVALRVIKKPPTYTLQQLKRTSDSADAAASKAMELTRFWERVDEELMKLRGIEVESPEFPRQLSKFITALAEAPKYEDVDSNSIGYVSKELRELSPHLQSVVGGLATSPVDATLIQRVWPDFGEADRALLADLLGIAPDQFRPSPFRQADIDSVLEATALLASRAGYEDRLNMTPSLARAIESNRRAKAALHIGALMDGEFITPEWGEAILSRSAANLPEALQRSALSQRIGSNRKLIGGKIQSGDLVSYMAGQFALSRVLRGDAVTPEDIGFARAYLNARASVKGTSAIPQHLTPAERSYLQSLYLYFGKTNPQSRDVLNEWVQFLNQGRAAEPLGPKTLGAITVLVDNGPAEKPIVSKNDWHRVNFLTSGKDRPTPEETVFLSDLYERVKESPDYEGLAWHVKGLLLRETSKDPWKITSSNHQRLRVASLKTQVKLSRSGSAENNFADKARQEKVSRARALGGERVLEEARRPVEIDENLSSMENDRQKKVDQYYRDRLLGVAIQAGMPVSEAETKRAENAFATAARLKASVPLPPDTELIRTNLVATLAIYGAKPLDQTLFEDLVRFHSSESAGKIGPGTLRMMLDLYSDPPSNRLGFVLYDDGWTRMKGSPTDRTFEREFPLDKWLDDGMFDTKAGANKFGWELVGELGVGESQNPGLRGHKRQFYWGSSAANPNVPGDLRISVQTLPNGARTLEGFMNIGAGKKDDFWIAFAAEEVTGANGSKSWVRRNKLPRKNKKGEIDGEETVQKACARCHMSSKGLFDPKPAGFSVPKFLH